MFENYKKYGIILGFFFFVHYYLILKVFPLALKRFVRILDRFMAKKEQ
ncbi:MAG: hypothetical protein PHW04_01030 [Candidatus Wallbacteria bacterium]|nr:hypothetical protein [Candidatus Wallbacteria bacterium]